MVDTYEGRKVLTQPIGAVQVNASTFGALNAQSVERLGAAGVQAASQYAQLMRVHQDKADRVAVRGLLVEAQNQIRDYKEAAFKLEGVAAASIPTDTEEFVSKTKEGFMRGLTPAQAELFAASYDDLSARAQDQMLSYSLRKVDEHNNVTMQAEIQGANEEFWMSPESPEVEEASSMTLAANIIGLWGAHGQDVVDVKFAEAKDAMYMGAVKRIALASPAAAVDFAKDHWEHLGSGSRAEVEGKYAKMALDEGADRRALALMEWYPEDPVAARKAAVQIDDPTLRKKTLERVAYHYAQDRNFKIMKSENMLLDEIAAAEKHLDPEQVSPELTYDDQQKVLKLIDDLKAGTFIADDLLHQKLMLLSTEDEPQFLGLFDGRDTAEEWARAGYKTDEVTEKMRKEGLMSHYRPALGSSNYAKLVERHKTLMDRHTSQAAKTKDAMTQSHNAFISEMIKGFKLDPGSQESLRLRDYLQRKIEALPDPTDENAINAIGQALWTQADRTWTVKDKSLGWIIARGKQSTITTASKPQNVPAYAKEFKVSSGGREYNGWLDKTNPKSVLLYEWDGLVYPLDDTRTVVGPVGSEFRVASRNGTVERGFFDPITDHWAVLTGEDRE